MMTRALQVLNKLDLAKTQLCHFKAIVITVMGFFTDSYDLFYISLVTKLLGHIYPGSLPLNASTAVNGVAFCVTLASQLFFGWLGNKIGRKKVYGLTLMLAVICSIVSCLLRHGSLAAYMSSPCHIELILSEKEEPVKKEVSFPFYLILSYR
ncbi:Inorganic phosphate transporter 1-4 [Dendrobium catenatum]|uniref:H(+)/Pi cotransporter n=1 Tax=Dendrobium catenatum TaxID=906689 RepID=A0A2I0WUW3_9ASPA|nr:Inorganic phosphate transporter 1-4 [Dendrobium catenatum]